MRLPLVSVLFIGFNRAQTLLPCHEALLARTDYPRDRLELILCDDGSDAATRALIDPLAFDIRLVARRNEGLGANHNKGVRAATGDYLLSLQDDCLLTGPGDYLRRAVEVLEQEPDIDMVSLLARPELPELELRQCHGEIVRILGSVCDARGTATAFGYSDQPHVKRASFHRKAGEFLEGVPMTRMEIEFGQRTATMPDIKIATIDGLVPFTHIGADFSFNPVARRDQRIQRLGQTPLLGPLYLRARRLAKSILRRR